MNVEFMAYSAQDMGDVLEMMTLFNSMENYSFDAKIGEQNLIEFTENESLGKLYMIKVSGHSIGYIILTFGFSFEYKGRDAFIDEFFIKEEFRNMGIGSKAMDFIVDESNQFGINAIHLEVEPQNKTANRLYLSKGYKSNDRTLLTKRIRL